MSEFVKSSVPAQRWEDRLCAVEPGWTCGEVMGALALFEDLEGVSSHSDEVTRLSELVMSDAAELVPDMRTERTDRLAS